MTLTHDNQNTPRIVSGKNGRYIYQYNGMNIYEWDQTLEEVNVYIPSPPNIEASNLNIKINPNHLQIGIKTHDRFYIDEDTFSKVNTFESSWYLDKEERVIHVILIKALRGETWDAALMGNSQLLGSSNKNNITVVDPSIKDKIQQDLMKERFQEEHPGFDFRDASFNGSVPDPRTFMGGLHNPI